jgi:murein DD-endopeptidase MepM/ murein hydrolase activator NlpD
MKKRALPLLGLVVIAACVLFINRNYLPQLIAETEEAVVMDSSAFEPEIPKEPSILYGMVVDDHLVIEDKIKRNQRLSDILGPYNVSNKLIHEISQKSKNIFDVRKIATDKKYTLICNDDSLKTAKALVYEPNAIDYVVFSLQDSLSVNIFKRDVVTVEKSITGEIRSNLSATIDEMGISHELTNKFVDVFGWQVDFQRLQKGDKFKLIYEEKQVEGKYVGIGKITAIYFEHFGHPYYAIPFDQGEGVSFFNSDGKSLRKALLRYPIEFTRISSRYTMSRFHPVTKVWKAHLGTDFAAPTGTPIRAVGDGTVEEAQYKSNNGNYVKIRHNATYTTQYLHMSRIASGVRAGTRVTQGQTIGYVGSTGLATGPHLCYRFWKNGVQVDALAVDLPPSEPIRKENMEAFEIVKLEIMSQLDAISFPAGGDPMARL